MGHVLRRNPEIPAIHAIRHYFSNTNQPKYRGRPTTTIATVTKTDIESKNITVTTSNPSGHSTSQKLSFQFIHEIETIKKLSENRLLWQRLKPKLNLRSNSPGGKAQADNP